MSRTWFRQYTNVKQHPGAEGARAPRGTGWGAPAPPSFMSISFFCYIFVPFFTGVFIVEGGGGRGGRSAQGGPSIAPPRPALPLVKCAGRSSGKRDDLNQGVWGCRGGVGLGPSTFVLQKKGACSSESSLPF